MSHKLNAATLTLVTTAVLCLGLSGVAHAETVVQVPLPGLLDARSVTTLTAGQLVVFTLPTDGGGLQNAFATAAVAQSKGAPTVNALPDDGRFAATARHPEVVLNFSNAAAADAPQTHLVAPSASFDFAVPAATYSKLFLFFNGAAGGATIKVTLNYADAMEQHTATIPDYYADISPTDPQIFNLATGLAKWDKTTKINEADHHNITGVELNGLAGKTLTTVKVERGAEGNLVFWGATGIATTDVAAGGAGGQGGAAGASGAGGAVGGVAGVAGGGNGGAGSGGAFAGAAGLAGGGAAGTAGGALGAAGSSGTTSTAPAPSADGGGCRIGANGGSSAPGWLVAVVVAVVRRRRQRGGSSAQLPSRAC